jgi:hypothetical protein
VATTSLRPLGIGEVLDGGIKVVMRHWRVMVGCAAGIVVPLVVLGILIQASADPEQLRLSTDTTTDSSSGSNGAVFGGAVALSAVIWVAALVANLACYRAAGDAWAGEPPSVSSSLRQGVRRLVPYIGMQLIVVLTYVVIVAIISTIGPVGLILLVPLVWLWPFFQIAQPILVLERIGPIKSLRRAFGLVRGAWWRTFWTLVLATLLLLVVFFIVGLALGLVFAAFARDSEVSGAIARFIVDALALSIALPYAAAINTVVYYDRRVRREGLDLQLQAGAPRWAPPSPDDQVYAPQAPEPEPEPAPAETGRADWLPPEAPRGPGGL